MNVMGPTDWYNPPSVKPIDLPERDNWISEIVTPDQWNQLGDQPKRILLEILPEFIAGFVQKSLHYGSSNANVLGPAGQFADIWRKIGPLRRALWEGAELTQEGPDEICKDLIGHSLLTIDMIRQGVDRRGTGGE